MGRIEISKPDLETWESLQSIFDDAAALPEQERAEFVRQECNGDVPLYREVMELLDAFRDGETDFELQPIAAFMTGTTNEQGLPEDAVAGYRILDELHRGGQGIVYRAVQLSTKRNVAIKFMLDGLLAGSSNKRRFEREVELAGSLRHPGIVSLFDSGLANGQYYFVMDLIEGRPLDRFVREENLPARSTLELLVGICEAVDYAHQRGVIHRDLKPSNILVDEDHHPYILDFGLATTVDQDLRETLSSSGQIMGTLAYMSPEHAVGRPLEVDLRSDVYSLGVVAYQLLTQCLPYPLNRSFLDDLEAIRTHEPDREALKSSRVDEEMSTILLKSLDKNKIRRYPTAGAMGDDIARYLCGEPIEAKRDNAWYVLQKTVKRHRTPFAVAASFLALLLVASVVSTLLFLDARKTSEQLRQTLYFSEMSFAGQQMHRPGGIGRIRELVSHWKTDDQGADLRGWEWYRLRAFCNRERLILRGHRADVWSVDWSPDGSQIASSSTADATLNLWDSVSGKKSATIQTSAGRWVRFSPQGDRLALCSFRGDVIIWDLHANKERFELTGHQDLSTVRCVDWRPDGKQLASCSNGGEIVIWDAIDGSLLRSFDLGSGRVASVSWNPEGTQLVAAAADRIIVLDAATGNRVWENDGWLGAVQSARWSPCGTAIAAGAQNEVLRILESSSGEVRAELNADPSGTIWCLDWSPNSQQIVTAHKDRTVRIWDADELTLLQSLHGSDQQPLCVRWSPDGSQIVSAGADYAVRVWDVRTQDRTAQIKSSHDYITAIAWDSSGTRIVSSGGDRMLQIWHLDRTERPLVLDTSQDPVGKTGSVTAVRWSPDDRYLASAGHDHTVRIWDASTGQLLGKMTGHEQRPLCLAWHPDGTRLASGGADKSVRIWDTQTGKQQFSIATGDLVTTLQWSPDGNFLAFADADHQEYFVSIRSSSDFSQQRRLLGADQSILALCWSPDGSRIAAGGQDSTARVWDLATAKQIAPALKHGGAVTFIDWLPAEGHVRLACASNSGEVCLWDVDSGNLALSFETPRLSVPAIGWNPDGRCLAAASGPFLCIWDAYPGVADPRYSERQTSE